MVTMFSIMEMAARTIRSNRPNVVLQKLTAWTPFVRLAVDYLVVDLPCSKSTSNRFVASDQFLHTYYTFLSTLDYKFYSDLPQTTINIIPFTNMQSGFRKQRSTTDHLVPLETFIREALVQKQHAVAVFFDLEKAYDTTWKCGIMRICLTLGFEDGYHYSSFYISRF